MSAEGSKAGTPVEATSKEATPKSATPAATPKETPAGTPKDGSKVGTPMAETPAGTPKTSAAGSGIDLDASHSYQIRPKFETKFRPQTVKEQIRITLNEELGGKAYSEAEAKDWVKKISDQLRTRMKEQGFERYKIVVQSVIGEQHGEGVKMGVRCLWDSDTDNYASDVFINETMFCVTAVYGGLLLLSREPA